MMPEETQEEYNARLFASLQAGEARLKWVSEYLDENIPKATRGGVLKNNSIGLDMARLIKLNEEMGEVVTNFIGFWGMNPRKGADRSLHESDIVDELYDVAFTALGAAAHFQGNGGNTIEQFLWKVASIKTRLRSLPEPHYFQPDYEDSPDAICTARSPLWDGPCGGHAARPLGPKIHLDPEPWFVEELVDEPTGPDDPMYRIGWDRWYESDMMQNLARWKPRSGYVQEQEVYRGGR